MWAGALALLFILALFFDAKAVTVGLVGVGALVLGGGKLLESAFSRLRVTRPAGRTYLFPGERAQVSIRIENPTWIPVAWLRGVDRLPVQLTGVWAQRWLLSIPPRSAVTAAYEVRPSRRGIYTLGPVDLEVGDPLGLHRRSGTSPCYHDLVVYPELVPLPRLGLPSNLPVGNLRARRPIYPDPSRLAGVRPYQHGDPRRWIHWKATARTGRTHVKQFEHTLTLETFILFNFDERDYRTGVRWHDAELAVTTAASLANYVASLGESFGFITNAHLRPYTVVPEVRGEPAGDAIVRLTPRKGAGQLMRVLEILAAAFLEPAASFTQMVADEARHFGWGSTLMLVTPQDKEELVNAGALLASSGYRVVLFVTGERVVHRHLLHQTPHPGLTVLHVRRGREAPLVVEGGGKAV